MKKKAVLVRSLSVCLAVLALMAGAGFHLLGGTAETEFVDSKVEAAVYEHEAAEELKEELNSDTELEKIEVEEENNYVATAAEPVQRDDSSPPAEETTVAGNNEAIEVEESVKEETEFEQPAVPPAVSATSEVEVEKVTTSAPVSYSWGTTSNYTFRTSVNVTNNGTGTSRNVMVSVPLLENSSPYQTTTLKSVNYNIVSTSGRVSTFNLGDIAPGETKTIVADFNITVRPVSINSSNETVEKARKAYEQYTGSGNCRDLARAFISKIREQGIEAREVIGYARPQRGAMTSGSLQGTRHSWAEFYVDGLGWVPVDLTFKYFGAFSQTSHIVESYSDQSIKVNFSGGSLSAAWSNSVL